MALVLGLLLLADHACERCVYSFFLCVCIYSVFYFVVLAIYSKSVGKSGKHSLVSDTSNIAAVSNIPVQLFKHFIGIQF